MNELASTVFVGAICGSFLSMLYVALKHQWPENYFQLDSTADPLVSRNMPIYVLFRFAPPFLFCLAAAVTTQRAGGYAGLSVIITLAVHCVKLVKASIKAFRLSRVTLAIGRLMIILLLTVLGFLAYIARFRLSGLVPTPPDLLSNAWAGLLAAIGAVFLQRVALVRHDPISIAIRCTRNIPSDTFRHAAAVARKSGVSLNVLLVILVAEDMQRPRWYRRLEFLVPGRKGRTTGIMQQRGARSDAESIDIAVRRFLVPATHSLDDHDGDGLDEARDLLTVEEVIPHYSEDPAFHEFVRGLADALPASNEWLQIVRTKLRE